MKANYIHILLAIGVAGFLSSSAIADNAFRDVLDTPAAMTELSSKQLITGLAMAGKRIVGVGRRGHIVFSDDGGVTWQQARVPVSADLNAVHFPTPQVGWAVGHDGVVLRTTDAGKSWERKLDIRMAGGLLKSSRQSDREVMLDTDLSFLGLWFESEDHGFIVGAFNKILCTNDGGRSWELWSDRAENPSEYHLYAIRAIGQDLFVSGEHGLVMKLDRQSGLFRKLDTGYSGTFFGVTGVADKVVAYGLRGNVYQSSDSGKSWRKADTNIVSALIADAVTPSGEVLLLSSDGQILRSRNSGAGFNAVSGLRPVQVAASIVSSDGDRSVIVGGVRGLSKQELR